MPAGPAIDVTPAIDAVQACRTCQVPIVNDELYGWTHLTNPRTVWHRPVPEDGP